MGKKYTTCPLAEHIEDYADVEFANTDLNTRNAKSIDLLESDVSPATINHKADRYIAAAAWFHEMKTRGMTQEEERYVELMLIELADFYFTDLDSRNPCKKCKEALCRIEKSIGGRFHV